MVSIAALFVSCFEGDTFSLDILVFVGLKFAIIDFQLCKVASSSAYSSLSSSSFLFLFLLLIIPPLLLPRHLLLLHLILLLPLVLLLVLRELVSYSVK